MRRTSQAGHGHWSRNQRAVVPALVCLLALLCVGLRVLAQETPRAASTPHYVHHKPVPEGAMVPTPGIGPPGPYKLGITIDGYEFMMRPGPCARRVEAAIEAHQDLLTGDEACDALIKQARAIQRQKEAEDPEYAKPSIAPSPTPAESEEDETH